MPTLDWIGKDKVINHHMDVPYRVLDARYEYGEADGNMIIHGDNLSALKSLLPEYEGRIRCIYIDPPYNTGNEGWVYNDNVNDSRIRNWLGEVVGSEGEDLSRHDKWLCMMYPRLKLLHKLLAEDGVIFISIDFHEQPLLRIIMDEIFGSSNYVSEIACVNKPSGRSDDKYIATAHESIIIYRKSELLTLGGFAPEEKITKRYNKTDSDGRLYREEDLRKRGTHDERTDRPNLFYPFFYNEATDELIIGNNEDDTPEGFIRIVPMKDIDVEGTWRWGKETALEFKSYIHPRYMPNKGQWSLFEWQYLDERGDVKPTTLWDFKDVNSERGTETFIKFLGFNKSDFPNPKPVGTIERIIRIATDKDSIILDSFSGSGTTAHAVLNMNKQDGGNRKFILIEMMDYADSITAERVKRVIDGYGEGKKAVPGTGGGFTFYELGETLLDGEYLNENVPLDKIRSYVYFTETKQTVTDKADEPYFLGEHFGTAYYFYYDKNEITTLDREFLHTVKTKSDSYVIYANKCILSDEELEKFRITFKKIPRDITRM
ncbi:MAG: site-specific DNA-methyltransferase [Ruminococcus sp.]|nr:site-specific DNA-methyltransferase [Ruminococcus sp.]